MPSHYGKPQAFLDKMVKRIMRWRKKKKKSQAPSSPRLVDAMGAIGERQQRRREELGG